LHRGPGQTQRELARAAAALLAASHDRAAAAAIPEAVVEVFYRVRFSDWIPDERQEAEIAAQLQRLANIVSARGSRQ
jgi:hypothetical protein